MHHPDCYFVVADLAEQPDSVVPAKTVLVGAFIERSNAMTCLQHLNFEAGILSAFLVEWSLLDQVASSHERRPGMSRFDSIVGPSPNWLLLKLAILEGAWRYAEHVLDGEDLGVCSERAELVNRRELEMRGVPFARASAECH